jgi:hypothetical protein
MDSPHPYFMSQVPDTIRLTRLAPGPKGAGFLTRCYDRLRTVVTEQTTVAHVLESGRTPLFKLNGDLFNRVILLDIVEMQIVPPPTPRWYHQ